MDVVENILGNGKKKKYDAAGNVIVPEVSIERQSEIDMEKLYGFKKKNIRR